MNFSNISNSICSSWAGWKRNSETNAGVCSSSLKSPSSAENRHPLYRRHFLERNKCITQPKWTNIATPKRPTPPPRPSGIPTSLSEYLAWVEGRIDTYKEQSVNTTNSYEKKEAQLTLSAPREDCSAPTNKTLLEIEMCMEVQLKCIQLMHL